MLVLCTIQRTSSNVRSNCKARRFCFAFFSPSRLSTFDIQFHNCYTVNLKLPYSRSKGISATSLRGDLRCAVHVSTQRRHPQQSFTSPVTRFNHFVSFHWILLYMIYTLTSTVTRFICYLGITVHTLFNCTCAQNQNPECHNQQL